MAGKEANIFKARFLSGSHGRKCGGYTRDGECALPGEISLLPATAPEQREVSQGRSRSELKPAEGPNGRLIRWPSSFEVATDADAPAGMQEAPSDRADRSPPTGAEESRVKPPGRAGMTPVEHRGKPAHVYGLEWYVVVPAGIIWFSNDLPNRRIRNRMSGGVGGGRASSPALHPIYRKGRTGTERTASTL